MRRWDLLFPLLRGTAVPSAAIAASRSSISISVLSSTILQSLGVPLRCQLPGQRIGWLIGTPDGSAPAIADANARASLQLGVFVRSFGRCRQAPVQMQLVFNFPGLRISPHTTTRDNDGRWAEFRFQICPAVIGVLVAINGERQPLANVRLLGRILVAERADRRTEHCRLRMVCRPPCIILGNLGNRI